MNIDVEVLSELYTIMKQYVPAKDRAGRGLVHPQVPGHVDAGAGQRHRRRPLPA